jgi:hypothetical protein
LIRFWLDWRIRVGVGVVVIVLVIFVGVKLRIVLIIIGLTSAVKMEIVCHTIVKLTSKGSTTNVVMVMVKLSLTPFPLSKLKIPKILITSILLVTERYWFVKKVT